MARYDGDHTGYRTSPITALKMQDLDVGALPNCGENDRLAGMSLIDGHRLVGLVSQADTATHSDDALTARLVEAISGKPANN